MIAALFTLIALTGIISCCVIVILWKLNKTINNLIDTLKMVYLSLLAIQKQKCV